MTESTLPAARSADISFDVDYPGLVVMEAMASGLPVATVKTVSLTPGAAVPLFASDFRPLQIPRTGSSYGREIHR